MATRPRGGAAGRRGKPDGLLTPCAPAPAGAIIKQGIRLPPRRLETRAARRTQQARAAAELQ
ncbi:hypothetical protein B0T45_00135 [Chromobacterium haemolyticum]|uniref:Uncharacterized protein n=1 Tax=Chromobacterium haemolyticum TaxID=394935 RepID=A0A1W0DAL5_9NEIS|nr:hypothetical protein B0T45_00135 [Chromobacterium haemolyticum]